MEEDSEDDTWMNGDHPHGQQQHHPDSSDEEQEIQKHEKRRTIQKQSNTSMPISFVPSAVLPGTLLQEQEQEAAFKKLVHGHENAGTSSSTSREQRVVKPPPQELEPEKVEQFKKYGKNGFALKFLQKFNFKGTLGKHGTGISEPIAVKARPERLGLKFGGFKEATDLETNKKIHAEQFGETELEARRRKRKEQEDKEEAELQTLWKKVKTKAVGTHKKQKMQKKRAYKTGGDLFTGTGNHNVLDMSKERKKKSKKRNSDLDSDSDAESSSSSSESSSCDEEKIGQELLHNLKSLTGEVDSKLNKYQAQQRRLERGLELERSNLKKYQHESASLRKEVGTLRSTLDAFQAASRCAETEWEQSLRLLKKLWSSGIVTDQFTWGENDMALKLAHNVFQSNGKLIELKGQGEIDHMRKILQSWVPFLIQKVHAGQGQVDEIISDGVLEDLELKIVQEWYHLGSLHGNQALTRRHEVDNHVLDWLEMLRPFVSQSILTGLAVRAVLPQLKYRVENWTVKDESWGTRLDLWIVPWLGWLRKQIRSTLHRTIRQRLVKTIAKNMNAAQDINEWVVPLVGPWANILSGTTFERLIVDGVVPKLVPMLKAIQINPAQQEMQSVRLILSVGRVVPRDHYCSLFEGEFFPKWLMVLKLWLQNGGNGEDIVSWYLGWKKELSYLLQMSDHRIEAKMGRALGLIGTSFGAALPGTAQVYLENNDGNESYEKIQAEKDTIRAAREKSRRQKASKPTKRKVLASELSTREFLDLVAPKFGATFMRDVKGRIDSKGRPIYVLADLIYVVIDSEVCFTAREIESKTWSPISLENLLKQLEGLS